LDSVVSIPSISSIVRGTGHALGNLASGTGTGQVKGDSSIDWGFISKEGKVGRI